VPVCGVTYLVEHVLELVLRQRTALDVLDGAELPRHALAVLFPHGRHLLLCQLLPDARVVPQIHLRADDEARHARAVVVYLGKPLLAHVLEGGGRGDAEADEEDVGLGVRERPQSVVIFLPGRVEEA
jgi:hypothetical protein